MLKIENTHDRGIATEYVLETFLKKINRHEISVENQFHKSKNQWSEETKSNLIVSIFNDYQFPSIITAEIIKNDCVYTYIIDGIQRINSCLEFKNNNLKIHENCERATIKYYKRFKDENNNVCFSIEEFDLCGKFYKDLPDELQDKFDSYNIHVNVYTPCTEEDILFHIQRYNSTNK